MPADAASPPSAPAPRPPGTARRAAAAYWALVCRAVEMWRAGGLAVLWRRARRRLFGMSRRSCGAYRTWIALGEPDAAALAAQTRQSRTFSYRPLLSIVTPVHDTSHAHLRAMLDSVLAQSYENWELCLADGGSTAPGVLQILEEYAGRDARIRVVRLPGNLGISGNTNAALDLARGEFVALVDHDDCLAPCALFEVASVLARDRRWDVIYSDRDLLSADGTRRGEPLFKPDWSPEMLLCVNYVVHLCVIRRSLVERVGRFRPETDGAQDWDLLLRVTEHTDRVAHVPAVLYHWRRHAGSVAGGIAAKPYALAAQKRVLADCLQRRGLHADVERDTLGYLRLRWSFATTPKASLVLTSRGDVDAVARAAASLARYSDRATHELILAHGGTGEMADQCRAVARASGFRFLAGPVSGGEAALRNFAASQATGDVLVFVNEKVAAVDHDWLPDLLAWAMQERIGVAAPKLLRGDGRLACTGLIFGLQGLAGELFSGAACGDFGPLGGTEWYRNFLAVQGACLATRRSVFDELSGFSTALPSEPSTVDYCLRARAAGYRVVYTPFARLLGTDGLGRFVGAECGALRPRLFPYLEGGDPYFNPHLSLAHSTPRLATHAASAPLRRAA